MYIGGGPGWRGQLYERQGVAVQCGSQRAGFLMALCSYAPHSTLRTTSLQPHAFLYSSIQVLLVFTPLQIKAQLSCLPLHLELPAKAVQPQSNT